MKILNLYAGIGGNRKLWGSKHSVTAVELDTKIAAVYQDLFKEDKVVVGDARSFLLDNYTEYDFIWSSPPCQSHSKMIRSGRNRKPRYPDLSLYEEIIFLQKNFKGGWVVENVVPYYKALVEPTVRIGRHLFWANFTIKLIDSPSPPNFIKADTLEKGEELKKYLGLEYEGSLYIDGNHCPVQVLRNCVNPSLGLHVLETYETLQWNNTQ